MENTVQVHTQTQQQLLLMGLGLQFRIKIILFELPSSPQWLIHDDMHISNVIA